MAMAWRFQRHVSAVQCGLQGAEFLERGLARYVSSKDTARALKWGVVGSGFAYQLWRGFKPPTFLMLLSMLEQGLTQMMMAL